MTKHTRSTVFDLLQSRWESDLPDKVLEVLRPLDGKMLTTRTIDKLPGGKEQWRLRRQYGMTHIESLDYMRSSGDQGVCLLVAHTESAVPIDVAAIEEKNPAYFSARRERNHARMEARNDAALLDSMANVLNRVERAIAELDAAKAAFDQLADYGAPFYPDRYELERACGLRDAKGAR